MTLELNDKEREYLVTLLENAYRDKLHELHHTDTSEFKSLVREEIALIEALREKMQGA